MKQLTPLITIEKYTLHKISSRVKIEEPPKYNRIVELLRKENHIKLKDARNIWYIINLAIDAKKTNNPSIEIFTGHDTLRKYVNYYKRKHSKPVTNKVLIKLLASLQDSGMLYYHRGGYKDIPKDNEGDRYTRYYHTGRVIFAQDFLAMFDDKFDITHISKNSLAWITTTDTRESEERMSIGILKGLKQELFDYNTLLQSLDIKRGGREFAIIYTRIFCLPDLTLHGRYYSIFALSRKENRHLFTINGNPLVELDFSSMFVAMLRDTNNLDKMDNMYQIDGFDRTLVKIAVNIMLNARSINSAIRAISKDYNVSIDKSKDLVNLISVKHHELKDYFFADSGMSLMRYESEITRLAQRDCVKKNIPVICLHDGYYTTSKHVDDLKAILELSYKNVIGADLNMAISIKEISAPHNAPQAKVIKKSYNDKPKIETYHVNA